MAFRDAWIYNGGKLIDSWELILEEYAEDGWITVHPGGKGRRRGGGEKGGVPVFIDDQTGTIKAGMGEQNKGKTIAQVKQETQTKNAAKNQSATQQPLGTQPTPSELQHAPTPTQPEETSIPAPSEPSVNIPEAPQTAEPPQTPTQSVKDRVCQELGISELPKDNKTIHYTMAGIVAKNFVDKNVASIEKLQKAVAKTVDEIKMLQDAYKEEAAGQEETLKPVIDGVNKKVQAYLKSTAMIYFDNLKKKITETTEFKKLAGAAFNPKYGPDYVQEPYYDSVRNNIYKQIEKINRAGKWFLSTKEEKKYKPSNECSFSKQTKNQKPIKGDGGHMNVENAGASKLFGFMEKWALYNYTYHFDQVLNNALRAGEEKALDSFGAAYHKLIDKAMAKSQTKKPMILYRGIGVVPKGLAVGKILEEKGYLSASTKTSVAEGFACGEGTVFTLKVSAGAHAISLSGSSKFLSEEEILFSRNTRYRVLSIKKKGILTYVEAEVLLPEDMV